MRSALRVFFLFLCLSALVTDVQSLPQEPPDEAKRLASECDQARAESCYNLGVAYANGLGVAKDEKRAALLYQRACDAGHAADCLDLGLRYLEGRGVEKDEKVAAQMYQRACDAGNAAGCYILGLMYWAGMGGAQDEKRAAQLLRQACNAGEARACDALRELPPDATAPVSVYRHPTYGWSISYPTEWKVDDTNLGDVRIFSPARDGLCGLHGDAVRFKTVDEFADFMQVHSERSFADKGVPVRSSPKQQVSLPNNVTGIDVLTDILSGGRSRRIYVLADGVGYIIDCETHVQKWEELSPFFARIISSFTLEPFKPK